MKMKSVAVTLIATGLTLIVSGIAGMLKSDKEYKELTAEFEREAVFYDHVNRLEKELSEATNETHIRLLKETIEELKQLS